VAGKLQCKPAAEGGRAWPRCSRLQFARTGVAIDFDPSLNGYRKSIRSRRGRTSWAKKGQFFEIFDEAKDHAIEAPARNPGQLGSDVIRIADKRHATKSGGKTFPEAVRHFRLHTLWTFLAQDQLEHPIHRVPIGFLDCFGRGHG